jgi:3-hydroxyisobutyrate dehydrogenase-like beta-hydroxyacid dehydrogenase
MPETRVGILHPGEMGSALGMVLRSRAEVLWASDGRSEATARRAAAGMCDVGSVKRLADEADVIFSVCPPHAALEVARSTAGYAGIFVDANAVSPATARAVASIVESAGGRCVDGGIVGPPPAAPGTTRLHLSGPDASFVGDLFAETVLDARVVSQEVGAASAVKATYAAWTKGTAALLLAIRAVAQAEGVEDALLEEWRLSQPQLLERSLGARHSADAKGWRWVGEMEEIASAFRAAGQPGGFHDAAAEVFSGFSRP